ncbi:hypothetical protein KAH37_09000 [bacterium]|nr:hypothetical protein [bacterium]
MKIRSILLTIVFSMVLVACGDVQLTESEARPLIESRIAMVPNRTVSFYVGPITDAAYLPVYRKIATGKYLTLKERVYIKAAKRRMPLFEKTKEGDKVLNCKLNRCEAPVCKRILGEIAKIDQHGKNATLYYTVKTVCEGDLYNVFKPLADKQYVKPGEESEHLNVSLVGKKWTVTQ